MIIRTPLLIAALLIAATGAQAKSKDLCQAGPESGWKPKEALEKKLTDEGFEVKRIKVDDGCYEVYGKDPKGAKIERFFHPVSFVAVRDGH